MGVRLPPTLTSKISLLDMSALTPPARARARARPCVGQVFTWSASGMIITETLALRFPTVLLYVVDTPRTTNPTTFMSNMVGGW